MQIELLNRQKWLTVVELSSAMADYIENFYNETRRHSSQLPHPERIRGSTLNPNPGRFPMTVDDQRDSGLSVEVMGFEPTASTLRT